MEETPPIPEAPVAPAALPKPKSRRGFAAMTTEMQRQIASKGGRAAHAMGRAHKFTSDQAREAGEKGGRAAHAAGTAHKFTSEEAQAAGRKSVAARAAGRGNQEEECQSSPPPTETPAASAGIGHVGLTAYMLELLERGLPDQRWLFLEALAKPDILSVVIEMERSIVSLTKIGTEPVEVMCFNPLRGGMILLANFFLDSERAEKSAPVYFRSVLGEEEHQLEKRPCSMFGLCYPQRVAPGDEFRVVAHTEQPEQWCFAVLTFDPN